MSAHGTRIWIVITDGVKTRICSCEEGIARPITAPIFGIDAADLDDRDLRAYRAWFKAEGQHRLGRNPRRLHLSHVSQVLLEGARDGAYEGLIVIAAEPSAAELHETLAPEARARLIGRIVRDFATMEPPAGREPPEIRH